MPRFATVPLRFRSLGTGAFFFVCSAAVALGQIQMPGGPKLTPLPHPDIAPPQIPEPGLPWWVYVAGGAFLIAFVALLLWLLLRRSGSSGGPYVSPVKLALDKLATLQGQLDEVPPAEAAHRVSVILREYQEGRYAVPAPYRTSEELYHSLAPALKDGVQERFSPLAEIYDRLAFAPVPSTRSDAASLISAAQRALEEERDASRFQPPPLPTAPDQAAVGV